MSSPPLRRPSPPQRRAPDRWVPPPRPGVLAPHPARPDLTNRELQVLRAMANGLSNRAIAAELGISENTVKTHGLRIQRKLGGRDRVHTVAVAFCWRLLHPQDITRPSVGTRSPSSTVTARAS